MLEPPKIADEARFNHIQTKIFLALNQSLKLHATILKVNAENKLLIGLMCWIRYHCKNHYSNMTDFELIFEKYQCKINSGLSIGINLSLLKIFIF